MLRERASEQAAALCRRGMCVRGAGGGGAFVRRGEREGVLNNCKDEVVLCFALLVSFLRSFDPSNLRDEGILS